MSRFPMVGITGGVGCGKSEVGRILAGLGVAVLDADEVAHEVLATGSPVAAAVVKQFGPAVVESDGRINRAKLAVRIFEDEKARRALEALVHPPTLVRIRDWVQENRGHRPAAVLIPLLFEVGLTDGWDAVWCVSAAPDVVQERLRSRGWNSKAVAARQAAQWPLSEKERRSDLVVPNNDSREALAAVVREAWMQLLKRSE